MYINLSKGKLYNFEPTFSYDFYLYPTNRIDVQWCKWTKITMDRNLLRCDENGNAETTNMGGRIKSYEKSSYNEYRGHGLWTTYR